MEKTTSNIISFVLFIISPIVAIYFFVIQKYSQFSFYLIWLLSSYFGFTYNFSIATTDGSQKANLFSLLANNSIRIDNVFGDLFYNEKYHLADIIEPLLMFVVSRFTHNPQYLFLLFGIIVGFFYAKIIDSLVQLNKLNQEFSLSKYFIFLFSCLIPFWGIGNFRFLCATLIFIDQSINVIFLGKKIIVANAILSIITHSSMILPFVLLLFRNFFRMFNSWILLILVLITSFVSFKEELTPIAKSFGGNSLNSTYLSDDYIETIKTQKEMSSWFIKLKENLLKFTSVFLLLFVFFKIDNKEYFVNYIFIFFIIGNISAYFPSGERILMPAQNLLYAFIIIKMDVFNSFVSNLNLKYLLKLVIFFIAFIILRFSLEEINIAFLFVSPIIYMFFQEFSSVWENIAFLFRF